MRSSFVQHIDQLPVHCLALFTSDWHIGGCIVKALRLRSIPCLSLLTATSPKPPHLARAFSPQSRPSLTTSSTCHQSLLACSGLPKSLSACSGRPTISKSPNSHLAPVFSPCPGLLTVTPPSLRPSHPVRTLSRSPRPGLTTSSFILQCLLACSGLLNLFQPVQGGRQYPSLLTLTLHQSSLRVRVFSPSPHPA